MRSASGVKQQWQLVISERVGVGIHWLLSTPKARYLSGVWFFTLLSQVLLCQQECCTGK